MKDRIPIEYTNFFLAFPTHDFYPFQAQVRINLCPKLLLLISTRILSHRPYQTKILDGLNLAEQCRAPAPGNRWLPWVSACSG